MFGFVKESSAETKTNPKEEKINTNLLKRILMWMIVKFNDIVYYMLVTFISRITA